MSHIEQFTHAMREAGIITTDRIIDDGKLHRFHIEGDKSGKKNGAYCLHSDGVPAGYFENFKTGVKQNWKATGDFKPLSNADKQRIEHEKAKREKEQQKKCKDAANRAKAIIQKAHPAPGNHPYLVKKRIKSHGLKISHDNRLIIPLYNAQSEIVSLQYILPEKDQFGKDKSFLHGGQTQGAFYPIGQYNGGAISISEGYATGASIYESGKVDLSVIAFNAGNLEAVAKTIRAQHPNANIIIFGDNDQTQTGETKGKAAAVAIGAKFIMPPNVGTDFNDALNNGDLTADCLQKLISEATIETEQRYTVQNVPSCTAKDYDNEAALFAMYQAEFGQPETTQPPKQNRFKLISAGELMAREYKSNWLVDGLIERGNLGLIFGNSASGKSLLVQDLCHCIATGRDFKGKPTQQGNVVYIAGEGFSGLQKRFAALAAHYGEQAQNLYLSEQPAAFMDIASASDVADAINEIGGAALVVIDTLHRNFGGGDENSAKDFAAFLANIDNFLKPTGAAILIIHHSGHDSKERSRGSSAIRSAMDIEYQVTKDGDFVTLKNTKMKDFSPPDPLMFKIKHLDTGLRDDSGAAVGGVVLEISDDTPPPITTKRTRLSLHDEKTLNALTKAIDTHGIEPPPNIKALFPDSGHNTPPKVVSIEQWRFIAYEYLTVDSNDQQAKRKAFKRSREKLESLKIVAFHGEFAWVTTS